MNYELFKKGMISLALTCAFAFSTLVGSAVPANAQGAQGYQRQYVYSYPVVSYPYSYQPYSYQPYSYYPNGYYPSGYYPSGYYQYGYYPSGYYQYDYHRHHHWYDGRHHIKRAFDWLF
jgi:hypothetical protein